LDSAVAEQDVRDEFGHGALVTDVAGRAITL